MLADMPTSSNTKSHVNAPNVEYETDADTPENLKLPASVALYSTGTTQVASDRNAPGYLEYWTCVVVAVTLLSGVFLLLAPRPVQGHALPAPCVWIAELDRTLAELGETGDAWEATDSIVVSWLDEEPWGIVDSDDSVRVHTDVPCVVVGDVVRHEWMHLQQIRAHGSWRAAEAYYGGMVRAERVADCGSMLLGSRYTPYLNPEEEFYAGECSEQDLLDARRLID